MTSVASPLRSDHSLQTVFVPISFQPPTRISHGLKEALIICGDDSFLQTPSLRGRPNYIPERQPSTTACNLLQSQAMTSSDCAYRVLSWEGTVWTGGSQN